ncbi:hypothetical protein [Winogradskyella sp. PG-2]|uniref:hypothetical protein n=1 Tax=Winogradskyella sp. PG-2 TaxID=754409 RepID=UPI00045864A1|nr:hypothetical protein [Winogradskyella sp. PG-2]BAO74397.1 hypothetical protein WPG_0167 [Winogradskyella sp. PG-2]
MKVFIIKLIKISVVFYSILWVMQFVIDTGLKRSTDDVLDSWNKIYKGEINAELLFLGTSRTLKHYDTVIFEKTLKMSSYNLGTNGTHFDSQFLTQVPYFEYNERPKIIVQNVDITALFSTDELYLKEQYFPYYNFENYKLLSSFDENITMEYVLPMYKYRGYLEAISSSLKSYFVSEDTSENIKGYIPKDENWNNTFEQRLKDLNGKKFRYSHVNFEERFEIFNLLVKDLMANSDKVFLVWAPEYIGRQILEEEKLMDVKKQYIRAADKDPNLFFLDFTNDTICNSTTFFYDSYHLNKAGAKLFSHQVSDSIQKHLNLDIR